MKSDTDIAKVTLWVLGVRKILDLVLRPILPGVIVDKNQSLPKVHQAAKRGEGLVIVFTHFSLRDALEVNRTIVFTDPVLKNREVVNPFAYHQYSKFMKFVGKFYHATLAPIVNNSTLAKKGFEHMPKGKGLKEFIALSNNVLSKGGVVSLAVNATRSEKLDLEDPQKPAGYLIASLQAKGFKNYGFLLVGFTIKKAKSYAKKDVGGFNIGQTYTMNLANYYSLEELLNQPEVKGKVANVDAFVRKQLAKVSPKEYLKS
jgi:hypothetical protein